nr:RNA-directed DNA polymerase, eukaryota [Tanacetum cinerariifolium]
MGLYKQNSLQSKFDQASRISKSVFVSNFPEGCTPKDIWNVCNDYGTVMDVFIPNKKSKAGKRFAFVRFIKMIRVLFNLSKYAMGKVKDVNSILNLWTLLMDEGFADVKLKYLGEGCTPKDLWKACNDYGTVMDVFIPNKKSKAGKRFAFVRFIKDHAGSYVNVVNGSSTVAVPGPYISSASALVFPMLSWGYVVMFEFDKVDTKVNMMQHIGVKSWFHVIQDVVHDFVSDESIVWVDIEGISLNVWSRETFMRIGKKWGETLDIEDNELFTWNPTFLAHKEMVYASKDESVHSPKKILAHSPFSEEVSGDDSESDVEEVSETIFGDNSSSPNNNSDEMGKQHSEDPFKIYDILKKQTGGETREVSSSLSHPPGFTPEVSKIRKENDQGAEKFPSLVDSKVMNNSQEVYQEINRESVDPNVRSIDERRGLCFNPSSARVFDHFISSSGLVDVKLEGYAFTWSHPSGSKMSKLDRFLVSEGLFGFWSDSLSVLSLMVQLGRFNAMVEQTWCLFSYSDVNRMIRFKKKLQDLKAIIRCWVKDKRMHRSGEKNFIKNELSDINKEVDRGVVSDTKLFRCLELQQGDENSKFFHGIINKKRSQLAIRGVFDNGLWCTDPGKVKEAFFNHFEARFKKHVAHRFMLNFPFNKRLSDMQAADLERNVSRDEIRLAV